MYKISQNQEFEKKLLIIINNNYKNNEQKLLFKSCSHKLKDAYSNSVKGRCFNNV